MRSLLMGAVAWCLVVDALPAFGQGEGYFLNGHDIEILCTPTEHPSNLTACAALIAAAADAANSPSGVMGYKSCLPSTVTVEQIRVLTLAMLKRRPDWLSAAAFGIVGAVTSAAYPCK